MSWYSMGRLFMLYRVSHKDVPANIWFFYCKFWNIDFLYRWAVTQEEVCCSCHLLLMSSFDDFRPLWYCLLLFPVRVIPFYCWLGHHHHFLLLPCPSGCHNDLSHYSHAVVFEKFFTSTDSLCYPLVCDEGCAGFFIVNFSECGCF